MIRCGLAISLALSLLGCAQAEQPVGAWQVPASGPSLDPDVVPKLNGKTCWGFFDKGTNAETARGATFVRFLPSSPIGDHWRKWGKEAQMNAHRDNPDGYDHNGKTTVAHLTPAGTEITMRVEQIGFDWFLRPVGQDVYSMRFVAVGDPSRGAVGELHCH